MGDAVFVEADIGQQAAVGDRQEGRLGRGPGVDYVDRVEVVGQPVLVVPDQQRLVGGDFGRGREAGAARVQRVLGQRLHAVEHQQVAEVHLGAVGDAAQLLDVLRHALLGEGQVLARMQDRLVPVAQLEALALLLQKAPVGGQHLVDDLAAVLADLPAHGQGAALGVDDGNGLARGVGCWVAGWDGVNTGVRHRQLS